MCISVCVFLQDERNQVLTTYLWIRQIWHDAYLKWDKEDYDGLEVIRIPSGLVWRPDIVLYNKSDSVCVCVCVCETKLSGRLAPQSKYRPPT